MLIVDCCVNGMLADIGLFVCCNTLANTKSRLPRGCNRGVMKLWMISNEYMFFFVFFVIALTTGNFIVKYNT